MELGFAENLSAWSEHSDAKSLPKVFKVLIDLIKMAKTIQGRHLEEIRSKMTKKSEKNCGANIGHLQLGVDMFRESFA